MKPYTVTVAVSAYNEERNISAWLDSVLGQKQTGFKIERIWIYSDGSGDGTVERARSGTDRRVSVFSGRSRRGKSARLNWFYRRLQSDFLVQSDADVILAHAFVVRDIIQPLIKNPAVGLCGGNPLPVPGRTVTEKAVNCSVAAYVPLRKKLRGGDNIFSADGRLLAFSQALIKKIDIPETDVIANDAYAYFRCLELGFKYRFVESARVWYRSPQTLSDHLKQNLRFLAMPYKLGRYFDRVVIKRETAVPGGWKMRLLLREFVRHPVLAAYIFALNSYSRWRVKIEAPGLNALWPMAKTTKYVD